MGFLGANSMRGPYLTVQCNTKDEVAQLLSYLEEQKVVWASGYKPTNYIPWDGYSVFINLYRSGLQLNGIVCEMITYGEEDYFNQAISFDEFMFGVCHAHNVELSVDEYL